MGRRSLKEHWVLTIMATSTVATLVVCSLFGPPDARADPWDFCGRVHNDDRVRPYDPGLRPDFIHAFKRVFPSVKGTQSDVALKAQAVFRCMEGKLVACFTGAASPCRKIDRSKENASADAFCRAHAEAATVPLDVSGPASEFTYRCQGGHAEISGTAWVLDDRGFAKRLWTPLDSD